MKTTNNLWHSIIDFENIYRAFRAASKGKRYRRASLEFQASLEENIISIQNELIWGTYSPLPLREFWINDPKRRLISAPSFRDRVVHHALVRIVEPCFERAFIFDSHACRTGHGAHLAIKRVQAFARKASRQWGDYHVYKGDIKGYFPSIHHGTLKGIIRRTLSDRQALALCDTIIDTYRTGDCGLPIGALTSQLFANIYLDQLDHHTKDRLGIKYYCRYMDDFVVIMKNKKELRVIADELERFVRQELMLEMNPKSGLSHAACGIGFCGFRVWPTHILARRSTIRRAARRLRKLSRSGAFAHVRASIMSFLGHLKHASAHRSTVSILNRTVIKGGSN